MSARGRTSGEVLTDLRLNRATLARQLLLDRSSRSVADPIQHLVGMQAQVPRDPYTALWSRLEGFQPDSLAGLLERRETVRAQLQRATIHLATADDCLELRPLLGAVSERAFRSGSPFGRRLLGVDLEELVRIGRALVEEAPRTRAELRDLLGERWPDRDADAMAYAIAYLVPMVQVTPRGLWKISGQARWATIESWLGRALAEAPSIDDLVVRYLGAFGPASVMDMQTWSGLTRLRETFERLRPGLVTFRSERGKELFDLPDAPRPDAEMPAPVRFLPEYDNLLLSHADRSRMGPDEVRARAAADWTIGTGSVLVDGTAGATWRIEKTDRGRVLQIRPVVRLSRPDRREVQEEAERLLAFLATAGGAVETGSVRFVATATRGSS
jgi:hypothetical protein